MQKFTNEKAGGGGLIGSRRSGGGLSDMFGNPKSLLGQPPLFGSGMFGGGMAPGAYGAVLLSAKRSLLSSSRFNRGSSYRNSRSRSGRDTRDIDFTADVDIGDTSPNGKDKRKSKREKFQPY